MFKFYLEVILLYLKLVLVQTINELKSEVNVEYITISITIGHLEFWPSRQSHSVSAASRIALRAKRGTN
jgi:hypothetical protein